MAAPKKAPRLVRFIRRHARAFTTGQLRRDRKVRARARRLLLSRFPSMRLRDDLRRNGD